MIKKLIERIKKSSFVKNIATIVIALLIFTLLTNFQEVWKYPEQAFDYARNQVLDLFGYQPYYMRTYNYRLKRFVVPKKIKKVYKNGRLIINGREY